MRGNITRRGKTTWRIKFEVATILTGNARYHVETVAALRTMHGTCLQDVSLKCEGKLVGEPL